MIPKFRDLSFRNKAEFAGLYVAGSIIHAVFDEGPIDKMDKIIAEQEKATKTREFLDSLDQEKHIPYARVIPDNVNESISPVIAPDEAETIPYAKLVPEVEQSDSEEIKHVPITDAMTVGKTAMKSIFEVSDIAEAGLA